MTSTHGVELADNVTEDPTKAIPLIRLLHFFLNAKGDPLSEATARDVMLHVWTKTENCENAMMEFVTSLNETDQRQRAA